MCRPLPVSLAGVFLAGILWAAAAAAQESFDTWALIRGDVVSVNYLTGANLRKIEARLRSRYLPVSPEYRDLFVNPAYPVEQRISARLQFLLARVEKILEMEPVIPGVNIEIFRSRRQLQEKCFQFTQTLEDYKSFYVHAQRSIYTSEQDIIDSIIAHEFGHVVLDHYFAVPPPSKVAELLAGFVDEHLERE